MLGVLYPSSQACRIARFLALEPDVLSHRCDSLHCEVDQVLKFLGQSRKATLFRKLKETRDEAIVPLQQLRCCSAEDFILGGKEGESTTEQNAMLPVEQQSSASMI